MTIKLDVGEITNVLAHFEWKISIDQLKSVEKKGDKICSPEFISSTTKGKTNSWNISLYPKGDDDSSDGYMGLFLQNENDYDVCVTCKLGLVNSNGEITKKVTMENKKIQSKNELGFPTFILLNFVLNPINNLIVEDKITIVCKIYERGSDDEKNKQSNIHSCQLMNESIFENKKYSDVTIVASDGVEFLLHKNILAAQSSVFEAMFDSDMKEKKENLVKIEDFDSLVLEEFFKFLYTDEFNGNLVRDLLILAEKYNVEKLKEECEDVMSLNVKVDKAIDYFKIADMHNAKKLKSNMIWLMASNLKILQEEPEYKSLTADQLREIIECHCKLFNE